MWMMDSLSLLITLFLPDYAWKSPTVQSFLHSFQSGEPVGLIHLDRTVFGTTPRSDLLYQALRYEESWMAQGTESSKALGQVRGSTRKPFPQKGRGKARQGTLRAPQFVGGFKPHGPRPHDKSLDIPRKVYNAAIRSALSVKFAQDQLQVVDSLHLNSAQGSFKQDMYDRLVALSLEGKKVFFVYGNEEPEVELIRAAEHFTRRQANPEIGQLKERPLLVMSARQIAVRPILQNQYLVLDKAAVEVLEEMYHVD
ncbi:ribosomal protein L4 domain-containing protein [Gaertneriomyces semiglobifer]|nr:ribosomal protein L4 domain-containing protein [Gaertneriomyces semiglobifer]